MLPLAPAVPARRGLEFLCIGAHSDDLEIGCAGTILRFRRELSIDHVTWVVLSGGPERASEARAGARRVIGRNIRADVVQAEFRDGFFPYMGFEIKEFFEALKKDVNPDVIFTHHLDDRHQDHRLVSELTYNTFRNHFVLEYEVFKVDGDLGNPNVYIPLDRPTVDRKVRLLMDTFASQRDRRWFTEDTFRAVARLRGAESGAESGLAEAFYSRKLVI
jgi:LmbE family N-acetylglucosaminyl deacetylase